MAEPLSVRELADAARAYVAARLANDAAEPSDWSFHAARVDGAWLALLNAFEQETLTARQE